MVVKINAERLKPIPEHLDPRIVLNESQTALLIGVNRRQLLRWRKADVGPKSEPYDSWTANGGARYYKLANVIGWRNELLEEGLADPNVIIWEWLTKHQRCDHPQPPQPRRVEPWRKKPEPLWRAQGRKVRKFKCQMLGIEHAMNLLSLRDRECVMLSRRKRKTGTDAVEPKENAARAGRR